ncbi:protein kinase domain-containing protein [Chloroflexus sp.]|uniref:protein kinase domain-containing protein n=1 Tax=Chloroflexus sp. TaxID=1904827 RepID=UPI00260B5F3E|nr:protein kinase [uncultured Chloroflexus sp.]
MMAMAGVGMVGKRFQIARQLHRTAHSIVVLAYDTWDDQMVVIKWLAPTRFSMPFTQAIRAFRREIEIVRRLSELEPDTAGWRRFPLLITTGRDRLGYYYVQRYLPGQTLAEILAAGRPDDAIQIAINLCWTLRILHAYGIIHGDLHPQNIIVGMRGEVALIDFGLSRYRYQVAPELSGVGRPQYTPPEQLYGQPLDERSDLFALSQVLQQLLAVEQLPPSTQRLIVRMGEPLLNRRERSLAALQAELENLQPPAIQLPPQWLRNGLVIASIIVIVLFFLAFPLR